MIACVFVRMLTKLHEFSETVSDAHISKWMANKVRF